VASASLWGYMGQTGLFGVQADTQPKEDPDKDLQKEIK